MKIVIITQDDPFYLADNLDYFINILPKHSQIVGCVINDVSPFGKKETFIQKALKTKTVFGLKFFIYYSFKFITNKFDKTKNVSHVLKNYGIPIIPLNKEINHSESVRKIKSYQPDILISILGNQIFKEPIINLAPKGCLNLHTALLPKYRGLMPTFWVMKNKEKYTGVSVFYVDEKIDNGPIVVQKKVEISGRTQEELIEHTKKLGMESIAEAIDLIEKNEVSIIPNDANKGSYYSFPTKEDRKVFLKNGNKFF